MNFLRENTELNEHIINEISYAIILHTISIFKRNSELRIDFKPLTIKDSPFAFLLTFCDNAQQWGRLKMFDQYQDMNASLEDVKINGNEVNIILKYPDRGNELKVLITEKMNPPISNWFMVKGLKFKITVFIDKNHFETFEHTSLKSEENIS